jgi:hypothetical protein
MKSRSPILRWLISLATSADLTAIGLSGNLDGIRQSPSSFFSVNFCCARFLQCACFLQCCSSCAFTSKSPNSAYPAISVVAIKDNNHQHAFVACSIFANISPFGIDGNTCIQHSDFNSPLHSAIQTLLCYRNISNSPFSPFDINVKEETFLH